MVIGYKHFSKLLFPTIYIKNHHLFSMNAYMTNTLNTKIIPTFEIFFRYWSLKLIQFMLVFIFNSNLRLCNSSYNTMIKFSECIHQVINMAFNLDFWSSIDKFIFFCSQILIHFILICFNSMLGLLITLCMQIVILKRNIL